MSFNVALSGLRAANQDLAVTGNNIANASTVGFKQSRAEFADVYAGSVLGSGSRTPGSGVLVAGIAQQFGQGNISITNNSLDMAISGEGFFLLKDQGAPVYTRAGIFGLDSQGYIVGNNSARLQGFQADVNGNILSGAPEDMRISTSDIAPNASTEVNLRFNLDSGNSTPSLAAGRAASVTGVTGPLTNTAATFTIELDGSAPLNITLDGTQATPAAIEAEIRNQIVAAGYDNRVSVGLSGGMIAISQLPAGGFFNGGDLTVSGPGLAAVFGDADVADLNVVEGLSLNPANPSTYNWSTAATVYDSLGNDHVLTTYYRKEGDNRWSVFAGLDDQEVERLGYVNFTSSGGLDTVEDAAGNVMAGASALNSQWDVGGGAALLNFAIDLAGSTQHGSEFSINALDQNGYAPGRLAGLTISDSGIISARYTNGQALTLGQVALANFANPQGLTPIGNTMWASSFDSGQPVIGAPQTASLGGIQSGALEDSNVDLSDQLVNLIIAQRNYQANAKTIETANAVTQSIINLR